MVIELAIINDVSTPLKAWLLKREVATELREVIGGEGVRRALRDPHSRRRPRPCGVTIHPGQGCRLGCLYCYVPDMGFKDVRKYPLSGDELAYALAINPWVVPGRTLAALGSVTEPFLPELVGKTLEYLRSIREWLKLPCQVSTKLVPEEGVVKELVKYDEELSVLVSASTISGWRVIEPGAPNPLDRIRGWGRLKSSGMRLDLFLRPLIPGVTSREDIAELVGYAASSGFKGVIPGSLRVTKGNIMRLGSVNVGIKELLRRAGINSPPKEGEQVPVRTSDLKDLVKEYAEEFGIEYSPSACSASIKSHGMSCWLCRWGPCGGRPFLNDLREGINELIRFKGGRVLSVKVGDEGGVTVRVEGVKVRTSLKLSHFLSEYYRVRFKVITT